MRIVYRVLFAGMLAFASSARWSQASEEKIKPDTLPKPTVDALKSRFPEMKFVSVAKETDAKGQIIYDVELTQKDRKFETDIKNDGTMLEVEKEVMKSDWSKELISTVQSKFPNATITEVMEVDKVRGTKEVPDHLEVTVQTANDKSEEVLVTLDGKAFTTEADEQSAAGDQQIKPQDLPKEITAAIQKRFPNATLVAAEKGTEDGKPIFEASIKDGKSEIDVTLSPEGQILSFEKSVSLADSPKAMMSALKDKYPQAEVKRIEEIWENDKLTGYEATLITTKKETIEVAFDPAAKFIEDEKK